MRILSLVAVAAFMLSGVVRAADDAPAVPAKKTATQSDLTDVPVGSPAHVFGKIISMRTSDIVGMTEPHVLVKLESAPGDVEIVDLGSVAELKSNGIEPKEGKQLWVEGRVGNINGKPLVIAETLSESKMVIITRQMPLVAETERHAAKVAAGTATNDAKDVKAPKDPSAPKTMTVDANAQVKTIEGTVLNTRKVKIEGEADEHFLAKVQTEHGIVVLDLGLSSKMPKNVDLSDGKSIAAFGMVGHLNGKPMIVAESIGNLSLIERPLDTAVPTNATPAAK